MKKQELDFRTLARILTVHFSVLSSNTSPSCPPPDSFLRHLQPQHLQGFGCTSRTRFALCSGSARTPGESVREVALPCSEGHWWHTYSDLHQQLSSGGLVMQSVPAGQVVRVWVFNPLCSSPGGYLWSQIFCYKLCLQWLSKTILLTFFWLTLNTESYLPISSTFNIATASQITGNG